MFTSNEVRDVPINQAVSGSGLAWKLAFWGSAHDSTLLQRVGKRFDSLATLIENGRLVVAEGPALVSQETTTGPHKTRYVQDVVGKQTLNVKATKGMKPLFSFTPECLVANDKHFLDLRGSVLGLSVCHGPLVVVSAAFNFAVFYAGDLVVPRRQFGIRSLNDNSDFLKALSLFLSSDFAYYQQFFTATELGIKRGRINIRTLRELPIPIADYSRDQLRPWVNLHGRLANINPTIAPAHRKRQRDSQGTLFDETGPDSKILLDDMNNLVFDALGFDDRDRALVHDLVKVRLELNDGKIGQPAVRVPKVDELKAYARRLRSDLDGFYEGELDKWHQIGIIFDKASGSGMVQIDLISHKAGACELVVAPADGPTAREMERTRQRLRKQHSQWVYFDRNLRIYEGTKTFIFKPLQRFQWTESQAMSDAGEIIAEILQLGDDSP